MAEKTLANPTVEVNNGVIAIIPNSLSYKRGKGDVNMRAQSAGGDSVDVVKTVNAETKKSMVKFSLINTKTNIELYEGWQDAVDGVTVRFSDGALTKSFQGMSVITDPEVNLGAEGNIEVTFEGKPLA